MGERTVPVKDSTRYLDYWPVSTPSKIGRDFLTHWDGGVAEITDAVFTMDVNGNIDGGEQGVY